MNMVPKLGFFFSLIRKTLHYFYRIHLGFITSCNMNIVTKIGSYLGAFSDCLSSLGRKEPKFYLKCLPDSKRVSLLPGEDLF